MAVYDQKYRPYGGKLTPAWSRFLIIPRYAYGDIFQYKLFTALFAVCFVPTLVMAIIIYLHHNTTALGILELNVRELLPINEAFFRVFVSIQYSLGFLLTLLIGPPLVARDVENNALPLYLCRPFSRFEYAMGKLSVLVILLSAITWAPGLLLFLLQAYLEGMGWFIDHLWIGQAIFLSSWVAIAVLALPAVTLSAWVKWRVIAAAGFFALFMIPSVFALMINELFDTRWGGVISLGIINDNIANGLFRRFDATDFAAVPLWGAWTALALACTFCVLLLKRKVRAYEVVK